MYVLKTDGGYNNMWTSPYTHDCVAYLQDQFDRITDHTQKGIEFCEKYSHYVKDRSKIELDYANALRYD